MPIGITEKLTHIKAKKSQLPLTFTKKQNHENKIPIHLVGYVFGMEFLELRG